MFQKPFADRMNQTTNEEETNGSGLDRMPIVHALSLNIIGFVRGSKLGDIKDRQIYPFWSFGRMHMYVATLPCMQSETPPVALSEVSRPFTSGVYVTQLRHFVPRSNETDMRSLKLNATELKC